MKKVVLLFPDISTLTEFVLLGHFSHAEVNTKDFTLTSFLSEDEIAMACTRYEALVVDSIIEVLPA